MGSFACACRKILQKNPSECLNDVGDLSSQEIVSNGVCATSYQRIVNAVISDMSGMGMVISVTSVMLLGKVTGILICNMDESHMTCICCWQCKLEFIGFRCGAVHEVKKGACGVMWCIYEEVYGVVHEIEKIFYFYFKKVIFPEDYH